MKKKKSKRYKKLTESLQKDKIFILDDAIQLKRIVMSNLMNQLMFPSI